jgi:hypothetical protein
MKRMLNTRPIFDMLCRSGAWTIYRKGDTLPNTKVSIVWWSTRIRDKIVQGMLIGHHPKFPGQYVDLADTSHRYTASELKELLSKYHHTLFKPTLRKHSLNKAISLFNESFKLARQ